MERRGANLNWLMLLDRGLCGAAPVSTSLGHARSSMRNGLLPFFPPHPPTLLSTSLHRKSWLSSDDVESSVGLQRFCGRNLAICDRLYFYFPFILTLLLGALYIDFQVMGND